MKNRDPRFSKIRHDLTTTISTLQSLIKKLNAPEPKLTEAKYYLDAGIEKLKHLENNLEDFFNKFEGK